MKTKGNNDLKTAIGRAASEYFKEDMGYITFIKGIRSGKFQKAQVEEALKSLPVDVIWDAEQAGPVHVSPRHAKLCVWTSEHSPYVELYSQYLTTWGGYRVGAYEDEKDCNIFYDEYTEYVEWKRKRHTFLRRMKNESGRGSLPHNQGNVEKISEKW